MPSLRMRAWRVVRLMSRSTAAPLGPAMRHCVCFRARRMCWRSASSRVQIEAAGSVVEVTAEGALGDESRKIGVGGGDNSNIHALRAIAAEAFEFLLLKDAKKFRLKLDRKITDFVEEERAAVSKFEAANFLVDSAGE